MKEKTIIFQYNVDSDGNPTSTNIEEIAQVSPLKYTIQLEQIPDEQFGVILLNEDNTEMVQVFNYDEVETIENSYYVNYTNGIVYFNSVQGSEKKVINYYGTGVELISCKRVFDGHYDANGKWVTEILQDIIDAGRESFELMKDIGDIVTILQLLETKIAEGDAKLQELLDAIDEANDLTKVTGNEEVIINTSDWVSMGNEEYYAIVNHNCNSENIHVTFKRTATKENMTLGYTIINNGSFKVFNHENVTTSCIISAMYYRATQTISDDIAQEVVQARGGENTLGDRLNNIELGKPINVKLFGAIGDWNGTSGTDNLPCFKKAVDALPSTGGTILIENGDYWLSDTWTISKSNVRVIVKENAILRTTKQTTQGELLCFRGLGTGTTPTIKNNHIGGGGKIISPGALDNCVGFVRCDGCYVEDITVNAGHKGVTTQEYNNNIIIKDVLVEGANTIGVAIETGAENVTIKNITVLSGGKGVTIIGASNAKVKNVVIENIKCKNLLSDGIQISLCDRAFVDKCIIENNQGRGISVDNSSDIIIQNNVLDNIKNIGLNINTITGHLSLSNNKMKDITKTAIIIDSCDIQFIVNNNEVKGNTHLNVVNISSSPNNKGVFLNNIFEKGIDDIDYSYKGWKPQKISDIYNGMPFEMNYGANKRLYSDKPPSTGVWEQGDVVINSAPTLARNISQWVCRIGGSSPSWCANGIGRGTTTQRPTDLTTVDIGYCYYDSDLRKVISWNGFGWEI